MAVKIDKISIEQINGATPTTSAITDISSDTTEVTAGQNVTFKISFIDVVKESPIPETIHYGVYTSILGHNETTNIIQEDNPALTLTDIEGSTTAKNATIVCPEHVAGAYIAISFGIDNPPTPQPGIDQNEVKYLKIKSADTNAPRVTHVYWADKEKITWDEEENIENWHAPMQPMADYVCTSRHKNEDAFLHIHTHGMFGKKVYVELYAGDTLIQEKKTYTILDNVLCIAFQMKKLENLYFLLSGLIKIPIINFVAKVWPFDAGPESTTKIESGTLSLNTEDLIGPPVTATDKQTSKYVIGDLPQNSIVRDETQHEAIPADLNKHIGTISFLYGFDHPDSPEIEKVRSRDGRASGNANAYRYCKYQIDSYEIYLQDLIDADIIVKSDIIVQNETGTEDFNDNIGHITYDGHDIYYLTDDGNTMLDGKIKKDSKLDYKILKKLFKIIKTKTNRRIEDGCIILCRSAWQCKRGSRLRYKHETFRYTTNQECPPGAFYISPHYSTYIMYVSDAPTGSDITHWTYTTLTDDDTKREEIKKPNKDKEQYLTPAEETPTNTNKRDGIAFHRGYPDQAVGCLTMECNYSAENSRNKNERNFWNAIFSGDNGEYVARTTGTGRGGMYTKSLSGCEPISKDGDHLKLHFLLIEERNAVLRDDASSTDPHEYNRYRDIAERQVGQDEQDEQDEQDGQERG